MLANRPRKDTRPCGDKTPEISVPNLVMAMQALTVVIGRNIRGGAPGKNIAVQASSDYFNFGGFASSEGSNLQVSR
jgi:hypothetical protein